MSLCLQLVPGLLQSLSLLWIEEKMWWAWEDFIKRKQSSKESCYQFYLFITKLECSFPVTENLRLFPNLLFVLFFFNQEFEDYFYTQILLVLLLKHTTWSLSSWSAFDVIFSKKSSTLDPEYWFTIMNS